jgi:hypothetical protein
MFKPVEQFEFDSIFDLNTHGSVVHITIFHCVTY